MSQFDFLALVSKEMKIVESRLDKHVQSDLAMLNEAAGHLISAGGKRLRPGFALLSAKIYKDDLGNIIPLAAALELMHMATLVHDDVIDNSLVRRGTDTVKLAWGNRVSIYAGNFIFARAMSIIADYEDVEIIDILADTSMKICQGEIIQMLSCYNVNLGLKNYLRRIERKTALLISVSCQLGAILAKAPENEIKALTRYGYYLGMGFQITDDILDFVADEQTLGKPTGSDIRQGVITLPALYALNHSIYKDELRQLLASPEACDSEADKIIEMIIDSDGIDYSYWLARHYAGKARKQLDMIPEHPVKNTLLEITDYILERDY